MKDLERGETTVVLPLAFYHRDEGAVVDAVDVGVVVGVGMALENGAYMA